jgi:hypothetical protein
MKQITASDLTQFMSDGVIWTRQRSPGPQTSIHSHLCVNTGRDRSVTQKSNY